ncbi:MAG: Cof-type HAD-IIB family hydrolase [Desulfobacterota bacterium]|nr:Cof-type HAD-IIB family hydrolase [Thermodesulfobacteriota bacterium]
MGQKPLYLVSLDLDGTSVRYEPRLEMHPDVVLFLEMLRNRGVVWVMNSDRYTDTMADIAGLLEIEQKPIALLSCQRFIHFMNGDGTYQPLHEWNNEQMRLHAQLWHIIQPRFPAWKAIIEREFTVLECVANDLVFACMAPPEQTPQLRQRLQKLIQDVPNAQVSGNHDWSFILHASFSKARVLQRCAALLGIPRERIIAIGDGINDISMLNGSVAQCVGCPSNASPEVIAAVKEAGGIVADAAEAEGTISVLRHYLKSVITL